MKHLALILVLPLAIACDDDPKQTQMVRYSGTLENGAVINGWIDGAEICVVSHPEIACVTTVGDGTYSLELPADEEVEVEVIKEGFVPVRSNFLTRKTDTELRAQMFQPAAIEAAFTLAGVPYDGAKGGLLVRVYDPARGQTSGLAGVSMALTPTGSGPHYVDGLTFNAAATATTPNGNALFAQLEDATYALTLTSATHDCKGTYLWKDKDGALEVIVKPGFATYIYADCAAKPE